MARKIVFTSGMHGVGQSTICALTGCGLALLGKKTVLVDLSTGANSLQKILNFKAKYDIFDVSNMFCRLKQAVVSVPNFLQLFCLPRVGECSTEKISLKLLEEVLDSLNCDYDFVLIDCPIRAELSFYKLIFYGSEAIIVSTTDKKAVMDTNNMASVVCGCNASMKLFINKLTQLEKKRNVDFEIANWLKIELFDSLVNFEKCSVSNIMLSSELLSNCFRFGENFFGKYNKLRRINV